MGRNILIVILLIIIACLGVEVYNLSKETKTADIKMEDKIDASNVQKVVDEIEKQFIEQYLENNENVLEYEFDSVSILTTEEREAPETIDSTYKDKDILACVEYLVKPKDGIWAGASEEIEGREGWWSSGLLVTFDDGVLDIVGTGW